MKAGKPIDRYSERVSTSKSLADMRGRVIYVDNVNLSYVQSHGDTDGTDVPSTIMMHADRYTIALMSADTLSRSI